MEKSKSIATKKVMAAYKTDEASQRIEEKKQVTLHNALVRSGQGLTLAEKRIVMLAIAKMDSFRAVSPANFNQFAPSKVTAKEYAEEYSIDTKTAYNALATAARNLYNRSINYVEKAKGKGRVHKFIRWVYEAHYYEQQGWIELKWAPTIVPALTGLKKNFTTYKLKQAAALRSVHSWRFLEIFTQYESTGWVEYKIDAFCKLMDATPKQSADFGKLRTQIIEPAVKELSEKDGWIITPIFEKTGRKVSKVRFEFKRDPQGRLF